MCQTDNACNALMPEGKDGVCYKQGLVQKQHFQMCDITNRKILDTIKPQKPQATFSCKNETAECDFQCKIEVFAFEELKLTISQSGLIR